MALVSFILGLVSIVMMSLTLLLKISFGSIPSVCAITGLIIGIVQNKKKKAIWL